MMALLLQSYSMIFLVVGVCSLLLLGTGLYWIFRNQSRSNYTSNLEPSQLHFEAGDIIAIAGDNVFSTQLDLARAYIETNKQQLAKHILDVVLAHGNELQQHEAQKLLASLG